MKTLLTIASLLIFSGCFSPATPPMNNYAFKCDDSNIIAFEKKQYKEVLKISLPHNSLALARRDIIFSLKDGKIGSYAYSQWIDTPADLLQNMLLRTIMASNIFTAVVHSASSVESELLLESEILQFIHKVDTSSVEVEVVLTLLNQNSRNLLKTKLFSYSIGVEENSAKGAAMAFNVAMNNLCSDALKWLSKQE